MIKGIIFDKDGTLFDTESLNIKYWCEAFKNHGASSDPKVIKSVVGLDNVIAKKILAEAYQEYGIDAIRKEKEDNFFSYIEEFGVPLKKGCFEVLEYVLGKYKVALATSTPSNIASHNIKKAGISKYFDAIVTGEMVQKGKPNPEIFLTAAKKLNLNPQEVIVVEDSKHGIKAAHDGGFISVLIPDQIEVDEEMRENSNYIFKDLCELILFLEMDHFNEEKGL